MLQYSISEVENPSSPTCVMLQCSISDVENPSSPACVMLQCSVSDVENPSSPTCVMQKQLVSSAFLYLQRTSRDKNSQASCICAAVGNCTAQLLRFDS